MGRHLKINILSLTLFTLYATQAIAAVTSNQPSARIIEIKPTMGIPPEMKADLESAIQTCEKQYEDVKNLKDRIDEVQKPNAQASNAEKDRYKNLDQYKRYFEGQFGQFAEFTNTKLTLREIEDPKELPAAQAEYVQNCRQFSESITGFVEWATKGKAPAGMDVIYKEKIEAFQKKK